jgi:diguanylate cyclase (GGDEF)-like protein
LLLKERGLFSLWGFIKIGFFVLEIAGAFYFLYFANPELINIVKIKLFAINFYPLRDLSMAIGIFCLFVITALIMFNRYIIYNTSFLIILLTYFLALYFIKLSHVTELLFLCINIIILTILIREAYRLAFYDELTSLPGRRALIEDMAKLGRKYSLAMCDIDFFKKFNDTYGHDTGDEVLKMVAVKLSHVGAGKAYRYGGEEFVILFPSKELGESFIHVDNLRQTIATSPFKVRNKKSSKTIFINISAGVCQNSSKDKDAFGVMKRADSALYTAKKAGRNQVVKA